MIWRITKACILWIFVSIFWTMIVHVLPVSGNEEIFLAIGGGVIIGLVSAVIIIK